MVSVFCMTANKNITQGEVGTWKILWWSVVSAIFIP